MLESSFLNDLDHDVLFKLKNRLIRRYFSGAIDADVAWEVPVGEVTVRYDNRSEEHTSELQSRENLVCRLLLEKKKKKHGKRRARTSRQNLQEQTGHAT